MRRRVISAAIASVLTMSAGQASAQLDTMAKGLPDWKVLDPLLTIGETIYGTKGALNSSTMGDYTPPGVLDGLGAYKLESGMVRVFANHELLNFRGYPYMVMGSTKPFSMTGARISYFDINPGTRMIVDAGIAYDTIYDANGDIAEGKNADGEWFLLDRFEGFSRFCSSALFEAGEFGLVDTIYFTGEEDGGNFNPVGGAEWALDVENGELWALPDLGRGAWENITLLETDNDKTIAVLLADDSSPFNADGQPNGEAKASGGNGNANGKGKGVVASGFAHKEAAPLFLYVGEKQEGNFLQQNGLTGGKLYVWVSDTGETTPADFNTMGSLSGQWVEIDNSPKPAMADENGDFGFDEYGYPTQSNLWTQAKAVGAFGFSRPEDVSTNPEDGFGSMAVLASTGVDTFVVDPVTKNGVDTFGTIYTIDTDFNDMSAVLTIIYDGDADTDRKLRSPDNLDWADDGYIYIQEDEAEEDTASGDEVLFGLAAANPNEAGIVQLNPSTGDIVRVANIDRSVVLDPSNTMSWPIDRDAGEAGEWESSGILDVSSLFDEPPGKLFLFDVQAHGIEDQVEDDSRITDDDLVEGGQLLFLEYDPS